MICTELMGKLSQHCRPNQAVILYFEDGLIFRSNKNTGIFESTNALNPEDPRFKEFYDCSFEISEVLSFPRDSVNKRYIVGEYFAISEHKEPLKIEDINGTTIWQVN